jgi:uncharacterized zinc-type alcohol dehydrogenase-like protein
MLECAAKHNVRPQIEIFNMSQVNEALKLVEENKARYRCVVRAKL